MIYCEGTNDRILLRALGFTRRQFQVAGTKSEVCRKLKAHQNAFALVDEDPNSAKPPYLRDLPPVYPRQFHIEVRNHSSKGNRIVILAPDVEHWLIQVFRASVLASNSEWAGLDAKALKRIISSREHSFIQLIEELLAAETPALIYLKGLLSV